MCMCTPRVHVHRTCTVRAPHVHRMCTVWLRTAPRRRVRRTARATTPPYCVFYLPHTLTTLSQHAISLHLSHTLARCVGELLHAGVLFDRSGPGYATQASNPRRAVPGQVCYSPVWPLPWTAGSSRARYRRAVAAATWRASRRPAPSSGARRRRAVAPTAAAAAARREAQAQARPPRRCRVRSTRKRELPHLVPCPSV